MARKTPERRLGFTELPLALSDFLIQSEGINSMRTRDVDKRETILGRLW